MKRYASSMLAAASINQASAQAPQPVVVEETVTAPVTPVIPVTPGVGYDTTTRAQVTFHRSACGGGSGGRSGSTTWEPGGNQ